MSLHPPALNDLHSAASTSVSARSTAVFPVSFIERVHASKQLAFTGTTAQSESFEHAALAEATARTRDAADFEDAPHTSASSVFAGPSLEQPARLNPMRTSNRRTVGKVSIRDSVENTWTRVPHRGIG